jgi:hypothetical protein
MTTALQARQRNFLPPSWASPKTDSGLIEIVAAGPHSVSHFIGRQSRPIMNLGRITYNQSHRTARKGHKGVLHAGEHNLSLRGCVLLLHTLLSI